jgi:signal transduction histidine kinase/ActR/RegA family two-component response regulator
MSFKPFFDKVRKNGTGLLTNSVSIRQVVYLNLIWLFTYSGFCFFHLFMFGFAQRFESLFSEAIIVLHFSFLLVFLLVRQNQPTVAKHLFLLTTYGMIVFFDHYFGKQAFFQIYFIAFLPTAFNIFTLKYNKVPIVIYVTAPLLLLLLAEMHTYRLFPPSGWAASYTQAARYFNIVMGFMLALLYAAYIIFTSGIKQSKLITQSVSLQTTLNNAIGAIWSVDSNFTVLACNKQFVDFVREEFGVENIKPGVNIRNNLFHKDVPEIIKNQYLRVFNGERFVEELPMKKQIYETKAEPIIDEDGQIIGATFNTRNITARKEAEKKLEAAKKAAEAASEAKARFLSNMSHELRTPLNGIVGLTNILIDEPNLPEQKKNLETLNHLSQHTLRLVNDILDFSKLEAAKMVLSNVRFHLKTFIIQLKSMFELTAKLKKLDFIIEEEGNCDVFVSGDSTRLNQVLINLLANALKFTEKGYVKLKVSVAEMVQEGKYVVHFAVVDTGIGIKNENIEKIFESFSQADLHTARQFGGTGLGLTISDKILHLMHSKLQVESEPGKGSVFFFTLHLKKSSAREKEIEEANWYNSEQYPLNLRVLMAEDNAINQAIAKRILEKWGIKVSIADNGQQAVQLVQENEFDIILMDLDMPVMDGYEATAIIRKSKSALPIIALTAASFDDMETHLKKAGFDKVVQKPFSPKDLYVNIVSAVKEIKK